MLSSMVITSSFIARRLLQRSSSSVFFFCSTEHWEHTTATAATVPGMTSEVEVGTDEEDDACSTMSFAITLFCTSLSCCNDESLDSRSSRAANSVLMLSSNFEIWVRNFSACPSLTSCYKRTILLQFKIKQSTIYRN